MVLKPAQIKAGINHRMFAGLFARSDFDCNGMLDVVQRFNPISPKPKAHKISARSKKNLMQHEVCAPPLPGIQAHELSLLAGVRIDHANAVCVPEDHRQITVSKTAQALQL